MGGGGSMLGGVSRQGCRIAGSWSTKYLDSERLYQMDTLTGSDLVENQAGPECSGLSCSKK